jgi:hypothetical protein
VALTKSSTFIDYCAKLIWLHAQELALSCWFKPAQLQSMALDQNQNRPAAHFPTKKKRTCQEKNPKRKKNLDGK